MVPENTLRFAYESPYLLSILHLLPCTCQRLARCFLMCKHGKPRGYGRRPLHCDALPVSLRAWSGAAEGECAGHKTRRQPFQVQREKPCGEQRVLGTFTQVKVPAPRIGE